jgi:23S rRNA (uracil1939-C5)-methyltransferase
MAATGEAVVRLEDGRRVLVAGALVGERVEVTVASKQRHATLRCVTSSIEERVEPSCSLASRCGGCDWMHASAELQSRLHRELSESALGHVLGRPVTVDAVHRPVDPSGYRSRARFVVEARGGRVELGYRQQRGRRLVALERCPVLHPTLDATLTLLPALLRGSDGHGEAHVALGREGRPVLELRWRGELGTHTFAEVPRSVQRGDWAGMSLWPDGAREPIRAGDPRPLMRAADGGELWLPAGGFGQASDAAAVALGRRVAELVGQVPGKLVELFAGSGTLTVMLAPRCEQLLAVEQHEAAAACLRENLAARGANATVRAVDAAELRLTSPLHTVVLDPPRGGARAVMDGIAAARPKAVVYVSCNALTLARDLSVLDAAGYSLSRLELFELFPQTSHVELVARLER